MFVASTTNKAIQMPPAAWSEWITLIGLNLVYTSERPQKIDNIIETNSEVEFANGQSSRDLRASLGNLRERTNLSAPLEALRTDSDEVLERRIELPDGPLRKSCTSAEAHRNVA
jgi:hypothetical protein